MKFTVMGMILAFGMMVQAADLVKSAVNTRGQTILADSFSRTLYVFDPDLGSGTSKCAADCAEIWPPYLLTPAEAKALVAPLGSVVRANKKIQLTYDGRPVYTFFSDRKAGDDFGDGLGGVWHVLQSKTEQGF